MPHTEGQGFESALQVPRTRQSGERMRLGEGVSLSGSLDPSGAARDEVYAVDLNSMGG